jgi:hypothetical protein
MKKDTLLLLFLIPYLFGCPGTEDYEFEYETIVADTAVNLSSINSYLDDYNSALPYPAFRQGIYFSRGGGPSENDFDIVHKSIDISYHQRDNVLNVSYTQNPISRYTDVLLPQINSEYNELGPLSYFGEAEHEYFIYANDSSGDFDIRAVRSDKSHFGTYNGQEIISEPYALSALNSTADDMYPVIFEENERLYFCSNREAEVFNIFSMAFSENILNPVEQPARQTIAISRENTLSSGFNDKCPFIHDKVMVFTSDREGGFGGYDLYYSRFENGQWSAPTNLGSKVNTPHDEYRPIIVPSQEFEGTMIIFSSNRPGGQGGFDLYAVRSYELP